ncbi:MAG: protein adenylyltransferase SelO [Cypionkella sp.]
MIRFDNSYARDLPGSFLHQAPDIAPAPKVLAFNQSLADQLGLGVEDAAGWFSGARLPEGADSIALAYAGHQFGGFSPQLGDGRAHLLGEFLGPDGRRWDLQLKGSGRTPFSRGGDGKAAVGPMLREYLISEAMAALGIPTTRSLAVVATGETLLRDQGMVPGAVLARVAASHIRVGTFQFFSARGEVEKLRVLMDYTIARHFPQVHGPMEFFAAVVQAQAALVAPWMGVGFVHGVMNTDNMALSGETIDYGPCAFMDAYALDTVFSSIDRQGRYAYGNQPAIMGWNLARLAETLLPFIDPDTEKAVELANTALGGIEASYRAAFVRVMRAKLALDGEAAGDGALIDDFLTAVQGVDWTLACRRLAGAVTDEAGYLALFEDRALISAWLPRWRGRLRGNAQAELLRANPAVIPRNHLVEAALEAATAGDMAEFEALLAAVRDPFGPEAGRERYVLPAPKGFGPIVTYCGT